MRLSVLLCWICAAVLASAKCHAAWPGTAWFFKGTDKKVYEAAREACLDKGLSGFYGKKELRRTCTNVARNLRVEFQIENAGHPYTVQPEECMIHLRREAEHCPHGGKVKWKGAVDGIKLYFT